MKKRKLRNYDEEFKRNAVSLYINHGKSYPCLSEELGVPGSTLAGWVNSGKYYKGSNNRKITDAELSEIKALRKELSVVKMERDILKKAVAIFTKPTNGKNLKS